MRILSINQPEGKSKNNLRTDARGASSGLGVSSMRAAHATPETVVTRSRHLLADERGARVVAEDAPRFVFSSRGAKIVAGLDASPGAIDALHRDAARHERETPAPTWGERRAA